MKKVLLFLAILLFGLSTALWIRHGGGAPYPNLLKPPQFSADVLEEVLAYAEPIGNVAVSSSGRIFFTSSLESLSPDTNALHVTPPLDPAPCTTRDPRWAWKRLGNGYARDSAGKARHERRRFARRGRGGRPGVMLEEAEDHDDVPVKVDDADEDDQVDDLA